MDINSNLGTSDNCVGATFELVDISTGLVSYDYLMGMEIFPHPIQNYTLNAANITYADVSETYEVYDMESGCTNAPYTIMPPAS